MATSLAICGLTRDSAKYIKAEVQSLDSNIPNNILRRWHVVESDSKDETVKVLDALQQAMPNFSYQSLGDLQTEELSRTKRLTKCRNAYLDWAQELSPSPDFVLVLDLDRANPKLTWDSIQSCLNLQFQWDALFANQLFYYDLYALRCPEWVESDPFKSMANLIAIGVPKSQAVDSTIVSKMFRISRDADPIEVTSAFGGAGLYRFGSIKRARYSAWDNDESCEVSEHVPFHKEMVKNGSKLYIYPAFVNARFNEHNRIKSRTRSLARVIRSLVLGG